MSGDTTGRIFEANGVGLYVEEAGSGAPLVLVHGGTASSVMWAQTVPLLRERFRVITFDSRGHGRSPQPGDDLSYRLIADDTAALIDALGLERPFVGGWSDGGQVALELGLHYPEVARALILGGVMTDFQSDASQAMLRSVVAADEHGRVDFDDFAASRGEFVSWLRQAHPGGDEQLRWVLQRTATMWLGYPDLTRERVAAVATPALVILGDRDDIPIEAALDLYRWLPNAELAILPGQDHLKPFLDPALFATVVTEYLERH